MIYDANNRKSIIEAAINDLIDMYFVGLDDKDIEYRLNTYFFLALHSPPHFVIVVISMAALAASPVLFWMLRYQPWCGWYQVFH